MHARYSRAKLPEVRETLDSVISCGRTFMQEFIHLDHTYDAIELGLHVDLAGSAIWLEKDFWQREKSNIFGIEYVTAGDAALQQDGKEYIVKSGELYFLRRGTSQMYRTGPSGYLHKIYVNIEGPLLDHFLQITNLAECDVIRPKTPSNPIKRMLKDMLRLMRSKEDGFNEKLSILAFSLFLELQKHADQKYPECVTKVIEFIHKNLSRQLTNEDIAAACGFSTSYIDHLFKSTLRLTPLQFHAKQRLASAAHLMTHSQLSIKEVAMLMGYEDPLFFSKRFRKVMGSSPSNYKRLALDAGKAQH